MSRYQTETVTGATTAAGQLVTVTVTREWDAMDREWVRVQAAYACMGCEKQAHVRRVEDFDALDRAMKDHARTCRVTPAAPRSW